MTDEPSMKRCPYCAEMIQEAAIVCRYCGRAMPGREAEVPAPEVVATSVPARPAPLPETKTQAARGCGKAIRLVVAVFVVLLVVAVGAAVFTGSIPGVAIPFLSTATPVPCPVQAAVFIKGVGDLTTEWDDTNKVANSTSRISLGPAVTKLQELRRKAAGLEAPPCAARVQTLLVDYMDKTINSYILFMAQKSDAEVSASSTEAGKALDTFIVHFKMLSNGEAQYK